MFVLLTDPNGTKIVVNAYSITHCRKVSDGAGNHPTTVFVEQADFVVTEEPEEVHTALKEAIAVPAVTCPPPPT
jgi:hypothetical protein